MSANRRGKRRAAAIVGHMHEVKPKRQAQLFASEVWLGSRSSRSETVFAGAGFDQCDEILHRLRRERRIDGEHRRGGDRKRDRREILDGVIGELVENRGIRDMGAESEENGVTVGCRFRGLSCADVAARTGQCSRRRTAARAVWTIPAR